MSNKLIVVQTKGVSDEELCFQGQDKKRIEELRVNAAKEANETYRQSHCNHCFRCGTLSLIEVDHKGIKIDLCINSACGAVYLDPGDMENYIEREKGLFHKIRSALLEVFK